MSISYKIEFKGDTLLVVASGRDESLEDTMKYTSAVMEAAKTHSARKVLCDERDLIYDLSPADTYALAQLASSQVPSVCRIALVSRPESLQDGKFFETVASNRGLRILVTDNYSQAQEWLQEASI